MANLVTGAAQQHPPGGRPGDSKASSPGRPGMRPQPWWLIIVGLMMANYLLMPVLFPEPASITIPYTFFKKQVAAGNVEGVTSLGDSI